MAVKELALAEDELSVYFAFEEGRSIPTGALAHILLDLDRIAIQTLGTAAHVAVVGLETGSLRIKFKVTAAWVTAGAAIAALVPAYADYFRDEPDPVVHVIDASQTTQIYIESLHIGEVVEARPETEKSSKSVTLKSYNDQTSSVDLDGHDLVEAIYGEETVRLRGKFYTRGSQIVFVANNGAEFYVEGQIDSYHRYMQNLFFEVTGTPRRKGQHIWLDILEVF